MEYPEIQHSWHQALRETIQHNEIKSLIVFCDFNKYEKFNFLDAWLGIEHKEYELLHPYEENKKYLPIIGYIDASSYPLSFVIPINMDYEAIQISNSNRTLYLFDVRKRYLEANMIAFAARASKGTKTVGTLFLSDRELKDDNLELYWQNNARYLYQWREAPCQEN